MSNNSIVSELFQNYKIDVYGNEEQPLFIANQIGEILGIKCTNSNLHDFDSDEKGLQNLHTLGGQQNFCCLTEKGLYRLIYTCRKPIGKQFRNFVYQLLHNLRIGKYKLMQQQLEEQQKQIEELKKQERIYNVYSYSDPITKQILYIGQSDDLQRRQKEHESEICKSICKLMKMIKFYREVAIKRINNPDYKMEFQIIKSNLTEQEALQWENKYITDLKPLYNENLNAQQLRNMKYPFLRCKHKPFTSCKSFQKHINICQFKPDQNN